MTPTDKKNLEQISENKEYLQDTRLGRQNTQRHWPLWLYAHSANAVQMWYDGQKAVSMRIFHSNTVHMYCRTLPAKQVCTTWIHTGML